MYLFVCRESKFAGGGRTWLTQAIRKPIGCQWTTGHSVHFYPFAPAKCSSADCTNRNVKSVLRRAAHNTITLYLQFPSPDYFLSAFLFAWPDFPASVVLAKLSNLLADSLDELKLNGTQIDHISRCQLLGAL